MEQWFRISFTDKETMLSMVRILSEELQKIDIVITTADSLFWIDTTTEGLSLFNELDKEFNAIKEIKEI